MKDRILRMLEKLDMNGKHIIHSALVGMTGGGGTAEEMIGKLKDTDLQKLYFCLQGMTMRK